MFVFRFLQTKWFSREESEIKSFWNKQEEDRRTPVKLGTLTAEEVTEIKRLA